LQLEHVPDGWTGAWWEGSPDGAIDGERLQRALDALPDAFREVVLMFYFEHLSYREIAARLEIPAGTVMSRLSRAKSQLRQQLESAAVGAAGGRRRSEP
jgi:RNA polymerase sigma-70 factor (ECF subfamily)